MQRPESEVLSPLVTLCLIFLREGLSLNLELMGGVSLAGL